MSSHQNIQNKHQVKSLKAYWHLLIFTGTPRYPIRIRRYSQDFNRHPFLRKLPQTDRFIESFSKWLMESGHLTLAEATTLQAWCVTPKCYSKCSISQLRLSSLSSIPCVSIAHHTEVKFRSEKNGFAQNETMLKCAPSKNVCVNI